MTYDILYQADYRKYCDVFFAFYRSNKHFTVPNSRSASNKSNGVSINQIIKLMSE